MTEENGARPPHQPTPCCPKCKAGKGIASGAPLSMTTTIMGPALCAVFFCANPKCNAILAIQVLEMNTGQPAQSKQLIVTQ